MPFTIESNEIYAKVSDVPKLPNVNNPDEPMFIPEWCRIQIYPDSIRVAVSGPLLSPTTGQPYKKKVGLASFDEEDLGTDRMPLWVLGILETATGTDWRQLR